MYLNFRVSGTVGSHAISGLTSPATTGSTLAIELTERVLGCRDYFRKEAPELLPKLLVCVEWGERAEAASAARMLASWPALAAESALELLDYAYADAAVRSFAVHCLRNIR